MKIEISSISLGDTKRYRSELKNIAKLAKSMSKPNGQLQPICVDTNGELIFGLRRLEAAKSLGWKEIEAVVVDLDNPLEAIQDENDDREAWPVSDRVALGKAIEEHEKEKAKERQGRPGKVRSEKFSEHSDEEKETGRAKDKAAEAAGMSRPTYEKAKEVIETAKINPAVAPIAEEMDKTGKVTPSHRKMKEIVESPKKDDAPAVDDFGNELPKRCKHAYQDPWIQTAIDELAIIEERLRKARLADAMDRHKKHYPFFTPKDFIDGVGFAMGYLDQLILHLKENRPAGVCPSCAGKGCADCKLSGLVPRSLYAELKGAK